MSNTMSDKPNVYLIVVDESEEYRAALSYAALFAQMSHARLAVLSVVTSEGSAFMPWSGVSERMEAAQKHQAQETLDMTKHYLAQRGVACDVYLREGNPIEAVKQLLIDLPQVGALILAANTEGNDPGPLVTHFSGVGLTGLSVPLTIVPSHINYDDV